MPSPKWHVKRLNNALKSMQWCIEGHAMNVQQEGQGASCRVPRWQERPKFRVISLDSKTTTYLLCCKGVEHTLRECIWGYWACLKVCWRNVSRALLKVHLRVFEDAWSHVWRCIGGMPLRTLKALLNVHLRVCQGHIEKVFEGALRAHLRAHRGRIWGHIEGASKAHWRGAFEGVQGHAWRCIWGAFEGVVGWSRPTSTGHSSLTNRCQLVDSGSVDGQALWVRLVNWSRSGWGPNGPKTRLDQTWKPYLL